MHLSEDRSGAALKALRGTALAIDFSASILKRVIVVEAV